ncbi:hypothetical protein TomMM35A_27130 [Sphingobium sp. TomMM35A]
MFNDAEVELPLSRQGIAGPPRGGSTQANREASIYKAESQLEFRYKGEIIKPMIYEMPSCTCIFTTRSPVKVTGREAI